MGTDAARALKGTKLKMLKPEEFKKLLASGNFSDDVHYMVYGSLCFDHRSEIHSWPKNLSVIHGSLRFHECRQLKALPENLKVQYDLHVQDCPNLEDLPKNLRVGHRFKLQHYHGQTPLPENLKVHKLSLIGYDGLKDLPENLDVNKLEIRDCHNLEALPENLDLRKLEIHDCHNLKALPENLELDTLEIMHCNSLEKLPEDLKVYELTLVGCDGLKDLTENLDVTKLEIRKCHDLKTIPENLELYQLVIEDCNSLQALPKKLKADQFVSIRNCDSLKALPDNLKVRRKCFIEDCKKLEVLSGNFKLAELHIRNCDSLTTLSVNLESNELHIRNCDSLTTLSENLKVAGKVWVIDCYRLAALPENLEVKGNLSLRGCTGLMALPEKKFSVGGNIDLSGCTSLTSLPSWITELGPSVNDHVRNVVLTGSGLSETLIHRLVDQSARDMRFIHQAPACQGRFNNLTQALQFWQKLAKHTSELSVQLQEEDVLDYGEVTNFLSRLTETADYQNIKTRPLVANRVMDLLRLITSEEEDLRCAAQVIVHQGATSCGDRVILAMDDLDTLEVLREAESKAINGDPSALRALGRQMMHLDEVKQYVCRHLEQLTGYIDHIEVELAFLIGLREHLSLPGSTKEMLFRNCAQVSQNDINKAAKHILADDSEEKLDRYLMNWEPWQRYQRRTEPKPFCDLKPKVVERLNLCPILLDVTDRMVQIEDFEGKHFDYSALDQWYQDTGNNPLSGEALDWSKVYRLEVESSSLASRLLRWGTILSLPTLLIRALKP